MYRKEPKGQLSFEDFYLPFAGQLNGKNRWIQLRERLTLDIIKRVNEKVIENEVKKKELVRTEGSGDRKEEVKPRGKLLLDATCIPQDIRYPTDISLLNEAREKTERIIDRLHQSNLKKGKKPRTYRKKARK